MRMPRDICLNHGVWRVRWRYGLVPYEDGGGPNRIRRVIPVDNPGYDGKESHWCDYSKRYGWTPFVSVPSPVRR